MRPIALTRFTRPWSWDGAPALIQSRATDEHGHVQPTHAALLAERPAGYYHYNAIHGWSVAAGGAVTNAA